jgi:putative two-component system response regulator
MRVLVVEDDAGDAEAISGLLAESGHDAEVERVDRLDAGLGLSESTDLDVILLDLGLPDSKAEETLERVRELAARVPVVVLADEDDIGLAQAAVSAGAQDLLVKGSLDSKVLGRVIATSLARKAIEKALRESEAGLKSANAQLEHMVYDVVEAMGRVVEYRDPYTQGHQTRSASVAKAIAEEMGCDADVVAGVEMAALVHDVGKLSVPAEILSKPGALSAVEMLLVREHPVQGFEILKDIVFPWPIATIVRQHHERMDGSGYPEGLRGDDLLVESRILAVADVVEAMASHRPYRVAHTEIEAVREVRLHRGKLYDPDVVDACLRLHESGRLGL